MVAFPSRHSPLGSDTPRSVIQDRGPIAYPLATRNKTHLADWPPLATIAEARPGRGPWHKPRGDWVRFQNEAHETFAKTDPPLRRRAGHPRPHRKVLP